MEPSETASTHCRSIDLKGFPESLDKTKRRTHERRRCRVSPPDKKHKESIQETQSLSLDETHRRSHKRRRCRVSPLDKTQAITQQEVMQSLSHGQNTQESKQEEVMSSQFFWL